MNKDRCYHRFEVPGARLRGATFDAPVVNLSKTGMAILTSQELEPGDSYGAWLETKSDRSWVEGKVVRCVTKEPLADGEGATFEVGLSVQRIDREPPPAEDSQGGESVAARANSIRSSPRVEVSGMRLRTADLEAEVLNFGSRGMAIRVDRALDPGEVHDAKLETRDGEVLLRAGVVWCERQEATEEGAAETYLVGLELSDVDQRLYPLADDFAPSVVEEGPVEMPDIDAAGSDDLAPWMVALTEEAESAEARPGGRRSPRRAAITVAVIAALAAAALWFFVPRGSEESPPPVVRSESAAKPPPSEPAVTGSVAGSSPDAQAEPEGSAISGPDAESVAWEAANAGGGLAAGPEPPLGRPVLGAIVPRADVNVRGGPGLEYPIVRRTGENERLPFVSRQGEWFRLQAEEEQWMHEVTVEAVLEATELGGVPVASTGSAP